MKCVLQRQRQGDPKICGRHLWMVPWKAPWRRDSLGQEASGRLQGYERERESNTDGIGTKVEPLLCRRIIQINDQSMGIEIVTVPYNITSILT